MVWASQTPREVGDGRVSWLSDSIHRPKTGHRPVITLAERARSGSWGRNGWKPRGLRGDLLGDLNGRSPFQRCQPRQGTDEAPSSQGDPLRKKNPFHWRRAQILAGHHGSMGRSWTLLRETQKHLSKSVPSRVFCGLVIDLVHVVFTQAATNSPEQFLLDSRCFRLNSKGDHLGVS